MWVCVCTRVPYKTIAWLTIQTAGASTIIAFIKFRITTRTHSHYFSNIWRVCLCNVQASYSYGLEINFQIIFTQILGLKGIQFHRIWLYFLRPTKWHFVAYFIFFIAFFPYSFFSFFLSFPYSSVSLPLLWVEVGQPFSNSSWRANPFSAVPGRLIFHALKPSLRRFRFGSSALQMEWCSETAPCVISVRIAHFSAGSRPRLMDDETDPRHWNTQDTIAMWKKHEMT